MTRGLRDCTGVVRTDCDPLFQFESDLFRGLGVRSPRGLLLSRTKRTVVSPVRLLEFCRFRSSRGRVVTIDETRRACSLIFSLCMSGLRRFSGGCLYELFTFRGYSVEHVVNNTAHPATLVGRVRGRLVPNIIIGRGAGGH